MEEPAEDMNKLEDESKEEEMEEKDENTDAFEMHMEVLGRDEDGRELLCPEMEWGEAVNLVEEGDVV